MVSVVLINCGEMGCKYNGVQFDVLVQHNKERKATL